MNSYLFDFLSSINAIDKFDFHNGSIRGRFSLGINFNQPAYRCNLHLRSRVCFVRLEPHKLVSISCDNHQRCAPYFNKFLHL